jgi:hypothetical protein
MYDEMENNIELSELMHTSEQAFCARVTAMVEKHYDRYRPYRLACEDKENYWRNRAWDTKNTNPNEPNPNVPVIHSTIENCVADVMDNYPDAVLRGVNGDDDDINAVILTESARFTMQRARHYNAYEKMVRACHIKGAGVLQTLYNKELADGIGDIDYKYYNIKDFIWDSDAIDIESGQFVATFDWVSESAFKEMYPNINLEEANPDNEGKRESDPVQDYDVNATRKEGIRVINFYWKEKELRDVDGNEVGSHVTKRFSAKIVGSKIVETPKEPYKCDRFMFYVVPFIQLENEPVGLSLVDIFKDDQDIINTIEKEFVKNL